MAWGTPIHWPACSLAFSPPPHPIPPHTLKLIPFDLTIFLVHSLSSIPSSHHHPDVSLSSSLTRCCNFNLLGPGCLPRPPITLPTPWGSGSDSHFNYEAGMK